MGIIVDKCKNFDFKLIVLQHLEKLVESVYDIYDNVGINDIEMMLYHDGRHEMLNEIEREGVFEDVYEWVNNHIK